MVAGGGQDGSTFFRGLFLLALLALLILLLLDELVPPQVDQLLLHHQEFVRVESAFLAKLLLLTKSP